MILQNYTCVGETSLIGANPNATLMDIMESEDPQRCRTGDCSNCLEVTKPLSQKGNKFEVLCYIFTGHNSSCAH